MTIRAVVFDCFGTLLHMSQHNPYGQVMDFVATAKGYRPMHDSIYRKWCMTSYTTPEMIARYFNVALKEEQFVTLNLLLRRELESIRKYAEVDRALSVLSDMNIKMCVASNLATPYVAPVCSMLPDMEKYYLSCDAGMGKPDHAFYQRILTGLGGLNPEQVLFVGDSLHNDALGPKREGFNVLHINRPTGPVEHVDIVHHRVNLHKSISVATSNSLVALPGYVQTFNEDNPD